MSAKVIGEEEAARLGDFELTLQSSAIIEDRKFKRCYYVLDDSTSTSEDTIRSTVGIPALWSPLLGAYCTGQHASEVARITHPNGNAGILWKVDCDFGHVDISKNNSDPKAQRPKCRWYGETEDRHLERDAITNAPIQTKCGEPIILKYPHPILVREIKRIETHPFNPDLFFIYGNHTNSVPFYGAPIGTALLCPMDVDETEINGVLYDEVTYKIKFDLLFNPDASGDDLMPDSWMARPLHQGYVMFKATTSSEGFGPGVKAVVATDRHGNPHIVNLDEDGFPLPPDAEPVYLEFNRFPKANLNLLNLGPF